MVNYVSRIPVAPEYTNALGQVYYHFAVASWQIVCLMSLRSPDYVSLAGDQPSSVLVRDFKVIATGSKDSRFIGLADRYADAAARRNQLSASVGITYTDGEQILDGSFQPWTIEKLNAFAQDLESLDIEANALYYELK